MDLNKTYRFYVVEFLDPPCHLESEKYFCVPFSWIRMWEASDQRSIIKFPLEEASVTKKRVENEEEYSEDWTILVASIKHGTDSYEDASNYITTLQNRLIQERSYAETLKEHESLASCEDTSPAALLSSDLQLIKPQDILPQQTPCNGLNIYTCKKQTEVVEIRGATSTYELADTVPQSLEDKQLPSTTKSFESKDKTRQNTAELSNDFNNKIHEPSVNDNITKTSYALNSELTIKLIFEADFLDQFKKNHSSLEEYQRKIDEIRIDYANKSAIMRQIIQLVENYKNRYINDSNVTTNSENATATDEDETEKNEGIVIEEAKGKHSQGEEKTDDNYTNVDKNISRKIRFLREFTLPKDYDKNDSRWTLRHPKKKSGLVELLPHSKVYVNAIRLKNCKRISNDSRTLARMLLVEIFSDNALRTCSLTGKIAHPFNTDGYTVRPGLDENARIVLFNYIEEHAKEKKWPKVDVHCIMYSVRNKIREMRAKSYK